MKSALVTAVAAALVLCCGAGLRKDEIDCEEAVSHLHNCCVDINPSAYNCRFVQGCESNTRPVLSIQTSVCIQAQSCESLNRSGMCERAQAGPSGVGACP
jgi:hypothetical protein